MKHLKIFEIKTKTQKQIELDLEEAKNLLVDIISIFGGQESDNVKVEMLTSKDKTNARKSYLRIYAKHNTYISVPENFDIYNLNSELSELSDRLLDMKYEISHFEVSYRKNQSDCRVSLVFEKILFPSI